MKVSHYNRERAIELMKRYNLVALIAQSPESVQYHSGEPGFFNRMLRNGYSAATVDFVDPELPPVMIVSNFEVGPLRDAVEIEDIRTYVTWIAIDDAVDIDSGSPVERPVQPTAEAFCDLVHAALASRHVHGGRIGVELNAMSAVIWELFNERLDGVTLVPCDTLFSELRAIKTQEEIQSLRIAATLTEAAISDVTSRGVIGLTHQELYLRFQESVMRSAIFDHVPGVSAANPINFNIGPDPFPVAGSPTRRAQRCDIVKLDAGVTVRGYRSDLGRTSVVLEPLPAQSRLARALLNGLEATLDAIRPGRPLRDAFEVGIESVRHDGFPRYARGHLGHAIGLAGREDYPFISATEVMVAEPGMTLAVEVPYYVSNLGAMLFEENIVVTDRGWQLLTTGRAGFNTLAQ